MERTPARDDELLKAAEQRDSTLSHVGAQWPISPVLQPGAVIEGRLEVQHLLASGGFGNVYKVRHLLLNKTLALKTLHPIVASDITVLRLKRESVAIAKLDHPNIVHATDFGLIDGTLPFIVMEYVEGQTLAEYLKKKQSLSVEEALQMFIPICGALAYAHDHGVIHRDIKPGNIMLAVGERDAANVVPKIVDFGIAKLTFGEDAVGLTLTKTGEIFGTPLYMSPEQCAGTSVDHRSDIYSVGCVLFEALTGSPPFSGNSPLETMMRHASAEIPRLKEASLGKEFPPALEQTLSRMLAKDERNRYPNCYEVATDLRLILQGDSLGMRKRKLQGAASGLAGRRRGIDWNFEAIVVAAAIGITIGIAFGVIIALSVRQFDSNHPAAQANSVSKERGNDPIPIDTGKTEVYAKLFHWTDQNEYRFPPSTSLGEIQWWTADGRSQNCKAQGSVSIPQNASVAFLPGENMIETPFNWGRFAPDDLTGLYFTRRSEGMITDDVHEADLNDAGIVAAWQQRHLQALEIKCLVTRERVFKLIGSMPELRWLSIQNAEITDAGVNEQKSVTGQQIAALPNLQRLDTLKISELSNVSLTPVLQALKNSHLRRLQLLKVPLTEADLKAIAQIQSVEVLQVETDLPYEKQLRAFSRLPNLRKLALRADVPFVQHGGHYNFPKLRQLWLTLPQGETEPKDGDAKLNIARQAYRLHFTTDQAFDWNGPNTGSLSGFSLAEDAPSFMFSATEPK